MPIRVAIAHVDARERCPAQWCRSKPRGLLCLGCHASLEEFVRRTSRQRPDVIVFGAGVLDAAAFGRIRLVNRLLPETPMLVLIPSADPSGAARVLRCGARGCLPNGCTSSDLAAAVRRLAAGKAVMPPGAGSGWVESLNRDGSPRERAALTARERQILALVALGCRHKEIGPELGIGDGTVHAHLNRALRKLRVHNKKAALEEFFGPGLSRSLHLRPPARPSRRTRFPTTLRAFRRRFASELACRKYLSKMRWPEGFCCPHCGSERAWRTRRGLWLCGQCRRFVSATASTLFEHTRIPLTVWFRAAWELSSRKRPPTIAEFRKALGLGSYKTAWACLHKLRSCLHRVASESGANPPLSRVEMFEKLLQIAVQTPLRPPKAAEQAPLTGENHGITKAAFKEFFDPPGLSRSLHLLTPLGERRQTAPNRWPGLP
jgi:DNA-binding NarL/FixJ family response regulator/ribosomal protein L37AE/L43A